MTQKTTNLDKQIAKLSKRIGGYDSQEKRLIALLGHGEVTSDFVLDEINRAKADRTTDQEELEKLVETRCNLEKLVKVEAKLNEFCQMVRENLKNCSFNDKRLALDALDIKVIADRERIEIKGVIPIDFTTKQSSKDVTTIEQTSA